MNIVITGGVGFIGTNVTLNFSQNPKNTITVVDDFSRPGVDSNGSYLESHCSNVSIIRANVQEVHKYKEALSSADVVIHLAGQTAVTTSITNPRLDFDSNLAGSFALLEAIRLHNPEAILLYSSTNKVYGDLADHTMERNDNEKRYENRDFPNGIAEDHPLRFISPYGCSKGAMDVYMEDYARIYGIKTVVFRQSCIYGPFQMGVEDQGWVAHFSKQLLLHRPITVFGDGFQVRDLLYVDDLTKAYVAAIHNIETARGKAYNIGGGPDNSYSLHQVVGILKDHIPQTKSTISFDEQRVGDQKYFVSDNGLLERDLGWKVTTPFLEGVSEMIGWQRQYLDL